MYAASLALFSLSLFAKGLGVMVPPVLLLVDLAVLRRWNGRIRGRTAPSEPRSMRDLMLEKLPFVGLALVFGVLAWYGQRALGTTMLTWDQFGWMPRLATAGHALCFYIWKSVVPTGLIALQPLPNPFHLEARFVVTGAIACAGLVSLWFLRRRAPAFVGALTAYVLLLLPVCGLLQTGPQLVADRYSYLPSLPLALIAAGTLVWSSARRPLVAYGLMSLAAVAALVLVSLSRAQSRVWHYTSSLFSHACDIQPANPLARRNLIDACMQRAAAAIQLDDRRELWKEAFAECARGLDAAPDPVCLSLAATILFALSRDELEERERWLTLAVDHAGGGIDLGERLGEPSRDSHEIHALVQTELGRFDEALVSARWLVERYPESIDNWLTLGEVLLALDRPRDALDPLQHAFEMDRTESRASYDLARAHLALGGRGEARVHVTRAIELGRASGDPELEAAIELSREIDAVR